MRRLASREAWPCCGEFAPMMDKQMEVVQRPGERDGGGFSYPATPRRVPF
jgi:hypothetical protein